MATAESVKAKLQGLITSANAKTGKSDANLTDAVNTLLEGYGQGGGGDCPINIVDELPATGEEGEIVGVKTFADVYAVIGEYKTFYSSVLEGRKFGFVTSTSTTMSDIPDVGLGFYYLTDIPDIYVAELGIAEAAVSLSEADMEGLPFKGEINSPSQATEDGYYAYMSLTLYQYTNGEFKKLVYEIPTFDGTITV